MDQTLLRPLRSALEQARRTLQLNHGPKRNPQNMILECLFSHQQTKTQSFGESNGL